MPSAGTHITIVERLASEPQFAPLLGNPLADPSTPEGKKMIFAKLGAIGPDILYAMLDMGADYQEMENFLIKAQGTFECLAEIMEQTTTYVEGALDKLTGGVLKELKQTTDFALGTLKNGLLAALVDMGLNFFPHFETPRQQDKLREEWYWADYLHYVKTGKFVQNLVKRAQDTNNPNLYAFALGYLTHYTTDIIGHPYVNQVVQSPARMYWQRHHLIENFIDAYVWDRWHKSLPEPSAPSTQEQPLDQLSASPNDKGSGSQITFSRLHDQITIGLPSLGDPVDEVVRRVAKMVKQGTNVLDLLGLALDTEVSPPNDPDFTAWTKLMADVISETYPANTPHPTLLSQAGLAPPRINGYPMPDDIAGAYGALRLFLRSSTEQKLQPPKEPDISGDMLEAAQKFWDDVSKDIRDLVDKLPPPEISFGNHFDWKHALDQLKKLAKYVAELAEQIAKTVFDAVSEALLLGVTIMAAPIRLALYHLNTILFSTYRYFRDVLVLAGYSAPFNDQLESIHSMDASSFWRMLVELPAGSYPVEEILEEEVTVGSTYDPAIPPLRTGVKAEQPVIANTAVAPYAPPTLPEDFLEGSAGPDNLFTLPAPPAWPKVARNFGGILENCRIAIQQADKRNDFRETDGLRDYNLDGDRGLWLALLGHP